MGDRARSGTASARALRLLVLPAVLAGAWTALGLAVLSSPAHADTGALGASGPTAPAVAVLHTAVAAAVPPAPVATPHRPAPVAASVGHPASNTRPAVPPTSHSSSSQAALPEPARLVRSTITEARSTAARAVRTATAAIAGATRRTVATALPSGAPGAVVGTGARILGGAAETVDAGTTVAGHAAPFDVVRTALPAARPVLRSGSSATGTVPGASALPGGAHPPLARRAAPRAASAPASVAAPAVLRSSVTPAPSALRHGRLPSPAALRSLAAPLTTATAGVSAPAPVRAPSGPQPPAAPASAASAAKSAAGARGTGSVLLAALAADARPPLSGSSARSDSGTPAALPSPIDDFDVAPD